MNPTFLRFIEGFSCRQNHKRAATSLDLMGDRSMVAIRKDLQLGPNCQRAGRTD